MKDTPAAVQARFHRQLLERSPEERLSMACRMFAAAKSLALASIAKTGAKSRREINTLLFLRFYGRDFSDQERDRILARLRAT